MMAQPAALHAETGAMGHGKGRASPAVPAISSPPPQSRPVELEARDTAPAPALIPLWTIEAEGESTPIPHDGEDNRDSPSMSFRAAVNETSSSSRATQAFPGLPMLDYKLYSPPLFELSEDYTTLSSRTSSHLLSNARDLAAFMRAQASVPPKPQIHVRGARRHRVDFDIKLNLMHLIVPADQRMRTDYVRCAADDDLVHRGGQKPGLRPRVGDGGLEEWCKLFVEDAAEVKAFVLNRTVTNLDTLWIDGQLRSLIASTGYKGNLTITFPTTHSRVVVRTADKVHKLVTSMKTMFNPKAKYEVVQAMWPFATAKFGVEGRQCVVQSEEGWWKEWRDPIKYAVVTKRHGWVTNEDKLEALMEGKGRGFQPIDWDMED